MSVDRATLTVVVYGDFNCPYSALASARAARLEAMGGVDVDWRAVEHDPAIPTDGDPVAGELAAELEREVDEVRGLLGPGETDDLVVPTRRPNTRAAVNAFAAASPARRPELREALYRAHWHRDADLDHSGLLARLGVRGGDEVTAGRWRRDWLSLGQPIVPAMVLPDGYVSRGLGALTRLATALADGPERLARA